MTKLSKRLETISNYIEDNSRIVDVGCDHALLDIYIVKNKKNVFCIASDILESALNSAKKNIEKYELSSQIDVRCGDGLSTINCKDNIDTIVISGLGYQKIIKILSNEKQKLNNIEKILIQSNTNSSNIREFITKIGYYIHDEKLVKENSIIYTIIAFKKGNVRYSKKEMLFGPILLKNKDKLFFELVDSEITKNLTLLKTIPYRYIVKRIKINRNLKILQKAKKSCL